MTIYAATDFIASNILLPLGALFTAVFAGWIMKRAATLEELELSDGVLYGLWRFLIRIVAPVAIVVLFVFAFI
jgi:NSS family neurotransmitter:Na+ symporter